MSLFLFASTFLFNNKIGYFYSISYIFFFLLFLYFSSFECVEIHEYVEISSSLWCSWNRWQCTKLHQTYCGCSDKSSSSRSSQCCKWANKREWSKTQETRWQMSNQNRYGCVLLYYRSLCCIRMMYVWKRCVRFVCIYYCVFENTSLKIQCAHIYNCRIPKEWERKREKKLTNVMFENRISFFSWAHRFIDMNIEHAHPPRCYFPLSFRFLVFLKLSPFLRISEALQQCCSFFFKTGKIISKCTLYILYSVVYG